MERDDFRRAAGQVLQTDDVDQILSDCFYSDHEFKAVDASARDQKPDHYKIICISIYNDDLSRLDEMVAQLKQRGLTKASRSALIRFALSKVDLSLVPRGL